MPSPPIGTVTLLLADVEGSVQGWETDRDAMFAALARLDVIVAEAVARYGGGRPLEQGEGDSFVAGFARASDAVACATDLQLAIAKEPWPGEIVLRVRMALHTGDVRVRDDGRYAGPALNRCARIRSLAHGGQTLLSRATCDLAADSLPEQVRLIDLGEHRLRDLARPERIHELSHPDLPTEFPPLRSLGAVPNNLPLQLTSFVGREAETAQVKHLLNETRALTLTGAGGCGKTRLALEVAADLVEAFPHGVWWVDLAPVSDPSLVPGAVAAALGLREGQSEALAETLVTGLRDRRLLLLLDNCEHLVSACAEIATLLLKGCPFVGVLATSREALGIDGETALSIPSLAVPRSDATAVEELIGCDSVELFIDRASKTRPNFRLTDDNAKPVAQVCRRLDGIPLAIELAAARARFLSPAQIAAGLSDRFHLLAGGVRTALPRQRTLEASVDWSYLLLDERERTVLARLSVFAGGFGLDAAEEVCEGGNTDRYEILGLLSGLVEKSLVQVDEPEPEARYRLLETIRAYASQRLADSGDASDARSRHLNHFVSLGKRAEAGLRGQEFASWSRRLGTELDNLRAAMDWAVSSGQTEKHLRLSASLLSFWMVRGLYSEVRSSMAMALDAASGNPSLRAEALATAALVSVMAGHYPSAASLAEEAVSLARETGNERALQQGLTFLGWSLFWLGRGGLDEIKDAHRLAEQIADPTLLERTLIYRGLLETMNNGLPAGRPFLLEAVQLAQHSEDIYFLGVSCYFAGSSAIYEGRFLDARARLDRSLTASRTLDNKTFAAFALTFLAMLAVFEGEYESARSLLDEALSEAADVGIAAREQASAVRGFLAWAIGDLEEASSLLARAMESWRTYGNQWWIAFITGLLGAVAVARDDTAEALARLDEAEDQARAGGFWLQLVLALHARARLARACGDLGPAEEIAHEALQQAATHGHVLGVADCLEALGGIALDLESTAEGARLLGAAERIRDDIGYRRFPVYQGTHARDLAALRAALGDEDFAARWSEGEAMSAEEAVSYAVRGRGERKRPSAGWTSLTPTELEVVRLVAQGLPNPEIASRLFVTRNTVKTHLAHVFAKVGVATRAQLAAEAARRGISPTPGR